MQVWISSTVCVNECTSIVDVLYFVYVLLLLTTSANVGNYLITSLDRFEVFALLYCYFFLLHVLSLRVKSFRFNNFAKTFNAFIGDKYFCLFTLYLFIYRFIVNL